MARKNSQKHTRKVKHPYFESVAKTYAFWLSIPFIVHKAVSVANDDGLPLDPEKLKDIGIDPDDKDYIKLAKIRTKTEFAKAFNVSRRQLYAWEKSEEVQKWVDEFNRANNILKFKKEVDFAFTRKVIKEADASRVKLWKQLYEGWVEKEAVEHSGDMVFNINIQEASKENAGDD